MSKEEESTAEDFSFLEGGIVDEAVNRSEQFVYEVCKKSFLSLWSYVNPQGRNKGKELCDILVVCDPDVIVISVKEVALKNTGDVKIDWERWERKAVEGSIRQIKGAIRWLDNTDRVIDKNGEPGLPLPPVERRKYHRIAVAFGGKGDVPIGSGDNEDESFVHVLDEHSFSTLLRYLDTISDFVSYLSDKEKFCNKTRIVIIGGEEELLAMYLMAGRQFPVGYDNIFLDGDSWELLTAKPEWRAKLERDRESYVWDRFIEHYCKGGFVDVEIWQGKGLPQAEEALRLLARENRFARRMLGQAFGGFLVQGKNQETASRLTRSPSGVVYVFLAYRASYSNKERQGELLMRCYASLCHFPDCQTVIGIGTLVAGEPPDGRYPTDMIMLQTRDGAWTKGDMEKAKRSRDEFGFFKEPIITNTHEDEYPRGEQDTAT